MLYQPHDYQEEAARRGVAAVESGQSLMIVAPCGSGKSICLGLLLERLPRSVLVVPTIEIGLSVYSKLFRDDILDQTEEKQVARLKIVRIWTAKRLYAALMEGTIDPPKVLLIDESHHAVDTTHTLIHALCGDCPAIGLTATPFRGIPSETAKLRAKWGEPYVALTLKAAATRGIVSIPDIRVWPLLNDETIKVVNGEFETKAVEGAVEKTLPALVERMREELFDANTGIWLRPTMVTCPGVASVDSVLGAMESAGLPAVGVTGDTSNRVRQGAFSSVANCVSALVHVNVVSEGVDLPMRVGIDLSPTMSPVRFMQGRIGRLTRPTATKPTYICTNHNVTRFSYLLSGVVPPGQIRDAQKAWGPDFKPSRRHMARALGLEGFGRFAVSFVPLADGTLLSLYALQTTDGLHQYSVLLHPLHSDPFFYERTNTLTGETAETVLASGLTVTYNLKQYGKWRRIDSIPSAEGYVSVKPQAVTPRMLDWWRKSAERRGLDSSFTPDARQFVALPILTEAPTCFD